MDREKIIRLIRGLAREPTTSKVRRVLDSLTLGDSQDTPAYALDVTRGFLQIAYKVTDDGHRDPLEDLESAFEASDAPAGTELERCSRRIKRLGEEHNKSNAFYRDFNFLHFLSSSLLGFSETQLRGTVLEHETRRIAEQLSDEIQHHTLAYRNLPSQTLRSRYADIIKEMYWGVIDPYLNAAEVIEPMASEQFKRDMQRIKVLFQHARQPILRGSHTTATHIMGEILATIDADRYESAYKDNPFERAILRNLLPTADIIKTASGMQHDYETK